MSKIDPDDKRKVEGRPSPWDDKLSPEQEIAASKVRMWSTSQIKQRNRTIARLGRSTFDFDELMSLLITPLEIKLEFLHRDTISLDLEDVASVDYASGKVTILLN